jgi:hypothetical protein
VTSDLPGARAAGLAGRRGLAVVVVLLAVAAGLLFAWGGASVARGAGLFCLAAVGGVLATRRTGRRLVGVAITLIGATTLVAGDTAAARVGGVLMVVSGAVTAWYGPRWNAMSARYGAGAGETEPEARPHDLWDALDRGEDPTA